MAIPRARRLAVEHLVQHAMPTFGTESAIPVEAGHAISARPISNLAPTSNSCCVVVGKLPRIEPLLDRASIGSRRVQILPKPNTEISMTGAYAPLSRSFSCRTVLRVSSKRLIRSTRVAT